MPLKLDGKPLVSLRQPSPRTLQYLNLIQKLGPEDLLSPLNLAKRTGASEDSVRKFARSPEAKPFVEVYGKSIFIGTPSALATLRKLIKKEEEAGE